MKTIDVSPQKRAFVEIQLFIVLLSLVSCKSSLVEKKINQSNHTWVIPASIAGREKLQEAANFLAHHYLDTFSFMPERDTDISTMIGRLDPYSCYMSKEGRSDFAADLDAAGTKVELGLEFSIKNDTPYASAVNEYSVCKERGLCIGDKLIAIDGHTLVGKSFPYLDSLLNKSSYLNYKLTFRHCGENEVRKIDIAKKKISGESRSTTFLLDSETAYFWANHFFEGLSERYESSLSALQINSPSLKNLIIDLRWNSGGMVDEALAMVSLLCETKSPILFTRSATHPENDKEEYTTRVARFRNLNVIVLVNEFSCSAAELFSGTLQDLDRALIIGQHTEGKGMVMRNQSLSDGSSLYYGVARYFLPSGRSIQIPYTEDRLMNHPVEKDLPIYNILHETDPTFSCSKSTFFTKEGRKVCGEMGVIPDILLPDYSNGYAVSGLSGMQRFDLEFEIVNRYQKLLIQHPTFESFVVDFPMQDAAKFLKTRLPDYTSFKYDSKRIVALLHRIMFYFQMDYYGLGTQTAMTLEYDKLVTEAQRIFQIESQDQKNSVIAETPKNRKSKKTSLRATKKLAYK